VKHLGELTIEDASVFFADGKPLILHTSKGIFPSLKFEAVLSTLPKVIVDMGAVPHIANGAQIMRPGVRKIEGQFAKDDLVVILDEKHGKAIALGIAEINSDAMQSMTKGRVINNVHYVGDPVWRSFATAK
jgi:PUA domain protein